jgi:hypothetical protein
MPRKGQKKRWFWRCTWESSHSSWKDLEACTAKSRRGFGTKLDAERAANRHVQKTGHRVHVWGEYK